MPDFTSKYRPQKISELDLISVRESLGRVLKSGKIPHAFLFAGPRGTGKTSAARILAKAVNCEAGRAKKEERSDFEPCNQCEQCLSITAGTNLDVLEIDAASNRGIDDIRDLREKVRLVPARAAYKIYIIDEVHMLTTEAFNALLKTLEEPPKHVIFILCTTEVDRLPETILSRCLRFNFKRATIEEIVQKLDKIAKEEKLDIPDDSLETIAKSASGSFRDSQKVLEQASFSEDKITQEKVKEILGQTAGLEPENLIDLMVKKDLRGALEEIKHVVEIGTNLRIYTEQLLEIFRNLLLTKVGVPEWEAGNTEGAENLSKALSIEEIRKLIEIFSKAMQELRDSPIPQLPLELAVIEWCLEKEGGEGVGNEGLVVGSGPASTQRGESGSKGGDEDVEENQIPQTHPNPKLTTRLDSVEPRRTHNSPPPLSTEDVKSHWKEILAKVKPKNHSIEALLRSTRPLDVSDRTLTLEVFYQFHKDKLESDKCKMIIEGAVQEVTGQACLLRCVLGTKSDKREVNSEHIVNVASGNGTITDRDEQEPDLLKTAEEIFMGRVE